MKTAVVNFKTTPEIKTRAQENLKHSGIPLSMYLNHYLRKASQTKHIALDFDAEEPSEMLIRDLEESEKDRKAGRVYSFDSIDDSMSFLKSMRNKK